MTLILFAGALGVTFVADTTAEARGDRWGYYGNGWNNNYWNGWNGYNGNGWYSGYGYNWLGNQSWSPTYGSYYYPNGYYPGYYRPNLYTSGYLNGGGYPRYGNYQTYWDPNFRRYYYQDNAGAYFFFNAATNSWLRWD
jgi:hypothetical protein